MCSAFACGQLHASPCRILDPPLNIDSILKYSGPAACRVCCFLHPVDSASLSAEIGIVFISVIQRLDLCWFCLLTLRSAVKNLSQISVSCQLVNRLANHGPWMHSLRRYTCLNAIRPSVNISKIQSIVFSQPQVAPSCGWTVRQLVSSSTHFIGCRTNSSPIFHPPTINSKWLVDSSISSWQCLLRYLSHMVPWPACLDCGRLMIVTSDSSQYLGWLSLSRTVIGSFGTYHNVSRLGLILVWCHHYVFWWNHGFVRYRQIYNIFWWRLLTPAVRVCRRVRIETLVCCRTVSIL